MTTKLLAGLGTPKTDIKICLNSRRKVYSTLDRIDGTVVITPQADVSFDDIDVEFVGTSRTYVERMSTAAAIAGRSQAFHQFLRLSQPGVAAHYPRDRVLRAGQTYKVPFVFAVPQQLLPRVCGHSVSNDGLRDEHLRLPPSLGDCEAESKSSQLDDLSPEMASIRYGVYTKITKLKSEKGQLVRSTIVAKARKVRIVPAVEEQPPISIDEDLADFVMRKERRLRRGLLKGKIGSLVIEAQQPAAFILPPSDAEVEGRTTTMATVQLRFDPSEPNTQPPRLNNLNAKLKATTYFSTSARRDYPRRSDGIHDMNNGFHSVNLPTSSRCMANVEWTRVEAERCASPVSTNSSPRRRTSSTISGPLVPPEPSSTYSGGTYYTARILVPIELPSNKAIVPTFHSCLISRVYSLGLSLSTNTAFGGNMDLRLPVQVAANPSLRNESPRGSVSGSIEVEDEQESDIDDFFEPRTIHAPGDEYVGNSVLADADVDLDAAAVTRHDSLVTDPSQSELPEYSLFAPGTRNQRVGVPAF